MTNFYSPKEITENLIETAKKKTSNKLMNTIILGILAGAYVAFGGIAYTTVTHDLVSYVGVGLTKFVGGIVFCIGIILVILAGASLFTGNILIYKGVLDGKVKISSMFRNWILVYLGNFVGAIIVAMLIYASGIWKTNSAGVAVNAVKIAIGKTSSPFFETFIKGVLCNWLVCLAVFLSFSAKDVAGKIMAMCYPVVTFVILGFEHSVANMYFIPFGMLLKNVPEVVEKFGVEKLSHLTWEHFISSNLLPVTIGNIVGGLLFVAILYYYLHKKR